MQNLQKTILRILLSKKTIRLSKRISNGIYSAAFALLASIWQTYIPNMHSKVDELYKSAYLAEGHPRVDFTDEQAAKITAYKTGHTYK